MQGTTATVTTEIDMWSAIRAVKRMAETYPLDRATDIFADELEEAATRIRERLRERGW